MTNLENRIFLNAGVEDYDMFGLFGKKKSDEDIDDSRRNFFKKSGIAVAGTILTAKGFGLGQEAKADSYDIIPKNIYEKIWRGYPEMIDIVEMLNAKNDKRLIRSALYPNQYWSSGGELVFNNVKDVPIRDMQSVQYWLLVKLVNPNEIDYRIPFTGKEKKGIPEIRDKGVEYFARGLLGINPNREEDLLKALFIGINGSENGAMPIINESYSNIPKVKKLVKKWKDKYNYAPYSNEGNHLAAYLASNFSNNFNNPDLVSLSLMMLTDYKTGEKKVIYFNSIGGAVKFSNAPDYIIHKGDMGTLPFDLF